MDRTESGCKLTVSIEVLCQWQANYRLPGLSLATVQPDFWAGCRGVEVVVRLLPWPALFSSRESGRRSGLTSRSINERRTSSQASVRLQICPLFPSRRARKCREILCIAHVTHWHRLPRRIPLGGWEPHSGESMPATSLFRGQQGLDSESPQCPVCSNARK